MILGHTKNWTGPQSRLIPLRMHRHGTIVPSSSVVGVGYRVPVPEKYCFGSTNELVMSMRS